jgi:hypothetical protein
MLSEKLFEDVLVKYPELIEERLKFLGRQVIHFRKKIDILFEDRFNEKLIVELKKDNLDRKALSQVMEYEGYILSEKDPSARVMIIANRIPQNLKKAMDHHGIEYKEITHKQLFEFLEKRDIKLFETIMSYKPDGPIPSSEIIGTVTNVKVKKDTVDRFEIWFNRNSEIGLIYGKTLNPEGILIKILIDEKVFPIGFHNTKTCTWLSTRLDRDGYNLTDLLKSFGIVNRDKLVLTPLGNDTYKVSRINDPIVSIEVNNTHSRRGIIIELINKGLSDFEILEEIDKIFPPGHFRTSNKQAIYGTRRDLRLQNQKITTTT